MIDDQLVLKVERLRDDVEAFRTTLKQRYGAATRQVTAPDVQRVAIELSERWLVGISDRGDVAEALGRQQLADRSVQFQRLLLLADRATIRRKYDETLNAILKGFRADVIFTLKAKRGQADSPQVISAAELRSAGTIRSARLAFVGKSFLDADQVPSSAIERMLAALDLTVITGEKPKADSVSAKVRGRIEQGDIFVGVFTRRDKLEGKDEWTTSSWVIDEKAFALAMGKKLILLVEEGVSNIGGLQGDYEYIKFKRSALEDLMIDLANLIRGDGG